MNEYPGEINFFMEREQMRPYEYLEKLGILGEHFIGAHSLLLSEDEKQLLAKRGVNVCHCPFSNCGKAAPDTPSLMSKGIPVSLGTDGAAHGGLSLWNEMKIFRSVMNLHFGVPLSNPAVMPAKTILKMATVNGQKCLGNPNGGVIREGASAGSDWNRYAETSPGNLRAPFQYPAGKRQCFRRDRFHRRRTRPDGKRTNPDA